jgi:hypothetical protein
MKLFFRTAFFWILFSVLLGGENWTFPYGVKGAILSVSQHGFAKFAGHDHFAFHSLHR